MKGILKIYHPEETLKYHIVNTYCKAVYSNKQHFLEVELGTNDSLDHVDDDSLQYNFPQLTLSVIEFPIESQEIDGLVFAIKDNEETNYTEIDLHDDEDAYLYDNELCFSQNEDGDLQLIWKGSIDDFYTGSEDPISFKLKCHFKEDAFNIEED